MRRVASLLSTAALVVGLSGVAFTPAVSAAPPGGNDTTAQPASVPDELLVGYAAGTSARERAAARSRAGSRLVSVVVAEGPGRDVVELVVTPAGGRGQAERRFEADPKVSYAEPNWIYEHAATSNDPYYTGDSLWGMYGDATSPVNQHGSQAGEAWAAGNIGSGTVYVGVIDEGIQIDHPDLAANIWRNPVEAAGVAGEDDDRNGYIDDVNGWDFDGNNSTVYDGTGDDHGTHVAGTIGATGGNGIGVAGVAWNVKLIPTKFLGSNGGTTENAIKAVDYLTDLKSRHNINLVASNNSWGGGGYSTPLHDAIERANAAGILFVAAAGNGGRDGKGDDTDSSPHYPSSYPNDNIISVAAIDKDGSKPSWSNYGATSVDLGAPGRGIMSTLPDKTYGSYSGTSMATPHVAGAAALYASVNAGASAATIKNAIMTSTIVTASMDGKTVSGGRLDAGGFVALVTDAEPPAAPATLDAADAATGGAIDLTWAAVTADDLAGYEVFRDGVLVKTVAATATSWTDSGLTNGTSYSYHVKAVDTSNHRSEASPSDSAVPSDNTAPGAPAGLQAVGGDTRADLTWSANAESDLQGYEIWRADITTAPVATVGKVTSWSDTGLTNGVEYSYHLLAFDTSGNRSQASVTKTVTPTAVPALTLVSATGYKVKGGWQQVDLKISGGDTTKQVTIVRTGTTAKEYSVDYATTLTDTTGKKGSGTYHYKVCQVTVCSGPLTVVF